MTHVLKITKVEDEESDDIEYEVFGPHDGSCETWNTCWHKTDAIVIFAGWPREPLPGHKRPATPYLRRSYRRSCPHIVTEDEEDEGEYYSHGVEHRYIDGDWMTLSDQCAAYSDSSTDYIWDIARTHGIGTYDVEIDYWGDGHWDLNFIGTHEETE